MHEFVQIAGFLVLAGVAGFVRGVFLLISPMRVCTWCKGTRRSKRWRHWGRVVACRKCLVTGKMPRLGAKTVLRWRDALREERRTDL